MKTACILACLFLSVVARCLEIGDNAPTFSVCSGCGISLSSESLIGKVVVLIYETRETVEQNRHFKKALKHFRRNNESDTPETIVVPVVNCSSAGTIFRGIWRSKLKANSKKENIIIYGDWDGRMATDFTMTADASNILVMDKTGLVRFKSSGIMSESDVKAALELLSELSR